MPPRSPLGAPAPLGAASTLALAGTLAAAAPPRAAAQPATTPAPSGALQVGAAGAVRLPVGDLRHGHTAGWGTALLVDWQRARSPLALRATLAYATLAGRPPRPPRAPAADAPPATAATGGTGNDVHEYAAQLAARLHTPLGRLLGATGGAYLLAGGALHHVRRYDRTLFLTGRGYGRGVHPPAAEVDLLARSATADEHVTRPGIHGGAGLTLAVGPAALFVEARYERVFTPPRAIGSVPVALGVLLR